MYRLSTRRETPGSSHRRRQPGLRGRRRIRRRARAERTARGKEHAIVAVEIGRAFACGLWAVAHRVEETNQKYSLDGADSAPTWACRVTPVHARRDLGSGRKIREPPQSAGMGRLKHSTGTNVPPGSQSFHRVSTGAFRETTRRRSHGTIVLCMAETRVYDLVPASRRVSVPTDRAPHARRATGSAREPRRGRDGSRAPDTPHPRRPPRRYRGPSSPQCP